MNTTVRKPATYADLEALPETLVGEILFGALVTHPRPAARHGIAATSLSDELVGPFQKGRSGGPGGWLFIVEPELHLGSHVAVPDIAGWRRESIDSDAMQQAFVATPPDWICEVLSDATERYDRGDKRRIYANYDVGHLWLLDPRVHLLEVFRRHDKDWLLTHTFTGTEDVCAPPFEAISFSLGLLWPFDVPAPSADPQS